MDLPAQAKLLLVIEERRLTRIGGKQAIPLNIRININEMDATDTGKQIYIMIE